MTYEWDVLNVLNYSGDAFLEYFNVYSKINLSEDIFLELETFK